MIEIKEKDLGRKGKLFLLLAISLLFLITGIGYEVFTGGTAESIIYGLGAILLSPTILMTDFIKVGGVASTLINVSIIGFVNVLILSRYKLRINGAILAAFFTVIGFSFFGKNIYNILPIYLGGYLYTRYQKISFKDVIVVVMFGTALSPMISEISFSGLFQPALAIIIAIMVGIFTGFIITPLSSHMLKFHEGYNLYNIGFTAGIIGTIFASLLRSFGIEINNVNQISTESTVILAIVSGFIFVGLLVVGFVVNPKSLVEYPKILKYKGRLITDYTHLVGYGVTYINMAILGLISLGFVLIVGHNLNGPIMAGIFTVVGFGAFGKHVKNCWPAACGVILAALLLKFDISSTPVIMTILFSTTLAPIAGTYGWIAGMIAGILHLILVNNIGYIHGGINLYNNGFAGGIVASVMIAILDAFKKEKKNAA